MSIMYHQYAQLLSVSVGLFLVISNQKKHIILSTKHDSTATWLKQLRLRNEEILKRDMG